MNSQLNLFSNSRPRSPSSLTKVARSERVEALTEPDNTPEGLAALLAANRSYRTVPWPEPYLRTEHRLHLGDARDLSWLPDESVHLVVTSPPYWTLKEYEHVAGQMADIADYETFLDELDKAWTECARVLVPGGRICCVVGDVCIPRKKGGRHRIFPLHADIQMRPKSVFGRRHSRTSTISC